MNKPGFGHGLLMGGRYETINENREVHSTFQLPLLESRVASPMSGIEAFPDTLIVDDSA